MNFKKNLNKFAGLILLISVVALLPYGCSSSGAESDGIEIAVNYSMKNVKPFEESQYNVNYEILPLQLPQYNNIKIFLNNIEVYNDYIFISTLRETIIIFDSKGNFVHKIPKGEEIDQISGLIDFMVNRQENKLEVLDNNKIIEFDLTGKYKQSKEYEKIYAVEYGISGEKRVFLRQKNSMNDYSFLIHPQETDFEWKTGQTKTNSLNPKHFHTFNNSLYFTGYSNNIYKLAPSDTLPELFAYVKNMNTDKTVRDIDMERYKTLCEQKKQFTYINNFFVYNNNLLGFTLFSGSKGFKILFDLEKNKYYTHPLTNVPYSQNNRWVEDGTEYYLFPPNKFEENAQKINNIAPGLYQAMEKAPKDYKMWIIKANYSKKE